MEKNGIFKYITIILLILTASALGAQETAAEQTGGSPGDAAQSHANGGIDLAVGIERSLPLGVSRNLSYSGFAGRLETNLRFRGLDFSRLYLSFPVMVSIGLDRSVQPDYSNIFYTNPSAGFRAAFRISDNFELGAQLLGGAMIFIIEDITSPDGVPLVFTDGSLRMELNALIQNTLRKPERPRIAIILSGGYGLNFETPSPGQNLYFTVMQQIRWSRQVKME